MTTSKEALMAKLNQNKESAPATLSKAQVAGPARTTTTIAGQEVSLPAQTAEKEKSYHVFYHTIRSCRMITKLGRVIDFVDSRYVTDQQPEIDYLQEEIKLGNFQLATKPGQEVMTTSQLNPMLVLREKFREELLDELVADGKLNPESSSEVQKLTPGSTAHTAALASDSGL